MTLALPDRPVADARPAPLHRVVETTLGRRELMSLLASDYDHVPVGALTEADVHLAGEDPGHMAAVAASVRRDGVRQPLVVRERPDGARVLLDGHHRAVVVLRERLARRVPVLLVTCPCTMGCGWTAAILEECRERGAADGWAS
jgi:hypothetical protein